MFRSPSLRPALPLVAALALAACGWHLRGELPGTVSEKTLFVTGLGPKSPFYGDFVQTLSYSGGTLAQAPAKASAVIHIASAQHIRRPITLSQQGRANTFDLSFRVVYDVRTPGGEILIPKQELEVRRDYFNDQISPLGQGEEEAMYRVEMQKEAAQSLLRRIIYSLRQRKSDSST
jgi:LPS-assembly lipoprotein